MVDFDAFRISQPDIDPTPFSEKAERDGQTEITVDHDTGDVCIVRTGGDELAEIAFRIHNAKLCRP